MGLGRLEVTAGFKSRSLLLVVLLSSPSFPSPAFSAFRSLFLSSSSSSSSSPSSSSAPFLVSPLAQSFLRHHDLNLRNGAWRCNHHRLCLPGPVPVPPTRAEASLGQLCRHALMPVPCVGRCGDIHSPPPPHPAFPRQHLRTSPASAGGLGVCGGRDHPAQGVGGGELRVSRRTGHRPGWKFSTTESDAAGAIQCPGMGLRESMRVSGVGRAGGEDILRGYKRD